MPTELEYPLTRPKQGWGELYRARGEEVNPHRPVFTGDVFTGLALGGTTGRVKKRDVIILQHPCAMRTNGADLVPQLLVAEVTTRSLTAPEDWSGNYALFPMPRLLGEATAEVEESVGQEPGPAVEAQLIRDKRVDRVAEFLKLHLVDSDTVLAAAVVGSDGVTNGAGGTIRRVASLSDTGIDLLMQRWVHHSSRVVVPIFQYFQACQPQFAEAELLEEWCDDLDMALTVPTGRQLDVTSATRRAVAVLTARPNADGDDGVSGSAGGASGAEAVVRGAADAGPSLQDRLKDPQNHSTVRRAMRKAARDLALACESDPGALEELLTPDPADAVPTAAGE